jgi:hemoglobin-like flavoprotein
LPFLILEPHTQTHSDLRFLLRLARLVSSISQFEQRSIRLASPANLDTRKKQNKMKEVGYSTIAVVLETWDAARFGSKDFDSDFGMIALERLFVLQPRAKVVFGYDKGEEEGKKSASVHAKAFAGLFDSVFQMLGPDIEFIEDILKQVGTRHKAMGVNPSFFPFMGQALMHALEQFLGKELTNEQRDAWEEVYDSISNEIVKTILS